MMRAIIGCIKFTVVFLLFISCDDDSTDDPFGLGATTEINLDADVILEIINQNRAAGAVCGSQNRQPVNALRWSDELAKAALDHSNDMQINNFFSHTSQDGREFSQRAREAGFDGAPVGENIARGYPNEEAVMQGWMESPGHCTNIMNENATHVGVARSTEGAFWTMVLGRN